MRELLDETKIDGSLEGFKFEVDICRKAFDYYDNVDLFLLITFPLCRFSAPPVAFVQIHKSRSFLGDPR
eukprot:135355-Rhodomonas_salina.1